MIYYGTRLSENISLREPEGYLLCLNVPVARTGLQEYMPEELDQKSPQSNQVFCSEAEGGLGGDRKAPQSIQVFRPESEVFSAETIASFEGMPVTNNHPPDGVTVDNIRSFQKGHAHNIRRGTGAESDLLLADLIITDPALISAIRSGKREISCGYTYQLCEENGQYIQRKIRGNHVAVVDAGRAGHRVSIKDEKPTERSQPKMKKSLLKKLSLMARDGDPEAIEALAEAVEEIVENPSAEPESTVVIAAQNEPESEPAAAEPETTATADDADTLSAILERLDQLIVLLTPAADSDPDPLPEELAEAIEETVEAAEAAEPAQTEPDTESIAAVMEEIIDPAVSTVLEPDDEEETGDSCAMPRETADALRAAMKAIRPALKRMPGRERSKVCADIAANLKKIGMDSGAYAALMAARGRHSANPADLGRRIMANRNPNYK